jgi:hypothetical protein
MAWSHMTRSAGCRVVEHRISLAHAAVEPNAAMDSNKTKCRVSCTRLPGM